jgi:inorganic triphosphatase YgiF
MSNDQHHEIELKLRVPSQRAAAVEKAVTGRSGSARTHLRAAYFDTPDFELAARGIGWRVRREGRQWIQTLKARDATSAGFVRLEHNVVVRSRSAPLADPALHEGTDAGRALEDALADLTTPPTQQYGTDVWRRSRSVRSLGGQVELAFDRGNITSGDATSDVCELEVELLRGSPHAVLATARHWIERHGLWLDTINKSQRGVLLASGATEMPIVKAPPSALDTDAPIDASVRTMVRSCLVQVMANASAVANGLGGVEHVHQTRIGIRKLRTVLREFADYSTAIDPDWGARLAAIFARLGERRDREVVFAEWSAALAAQGAPPVDVPSALGDEPAEILREPAFSLLLIDLLDYAFGTPLDTDRRTDEVVEQVLRRLHRGVRRHAKRFASATPTDRHAARKHVKRLRYVAELTASLYRPRRVQGFLDRLTPAQDALGLMNDLSVATELYRGLTARSEEAWFAVGWLSAHENEAVAMCVKPLKVAANAKPYWE